MMFHRHRQAGDRRSPQIRRFASCLTALFLGVVATVQASPAATGDASSGGLVRSDSTTALLVVYGSVFHGDGITPWDTSDTVRVTNQRNGLSSVGVIGDPDLGTYDTVLFDGGSNQAVQTGDTLVFEAPHADVSVDPEPMHILSADDLLSGKVRVDLRLTVMPSEIDGFDPGRLSALRCYPSPMLRGYVTVEVLGDLSFGFDRSPGSSFSGTMGGRGPVLDVWDLGGRLVREIAVDRAVPQGMRWIWDGRDSNGTAVPAGLYMAKVRGTGNALCAKVLRLR